MFLATLDGQLNVRFNQIIEQEIKKMGKVYEDLPRGEDGRLNLLLSDEKWHEFGYDKNYYLNIYRNLKLVVRVYCVLLPIKNEVKLSWLIICNY